MFGEGKNIMKFGSNAEFFEYVDKHPEVMKSVSTGGAAARLGITRQGVYELIKRGKLRAWFVYDDEVGGAYDVPGNKASYVYISMEDVNEWIRSPRDKGGRPPSRRLLTK